MRTSTSLKRVPKPFDGFSGSSLKIIAITSMIIDHIGVSMISRLPGITDKSGFIYALYWICRLIGRMAFPIYIFLLVEGFTHTRSKTKYSIRLLIFAIVSELPFDLALRGKLFDFKHQNVFLTLFIGLLVIWGIDSVRNRQNINKIPSGILKAAGFILPAGYFTYKAFKYVKKNSSIALNDYLLYVIVAIAALMFVYALIKTAVDRGGNEQGLIMCSALLILSAGMLAADLFRTDYSSTGVLAIVLMYVFRYNTYQRMMSGCIVLTALSSATELVSFVTIPLVMHYNGKRGLPHKYVFYAAYPLHLLILYGIARYLGLR